MSMDSNQAVSEHDTLAVENMRISTGSDEMSIIDPEWASDTEVDAAESSEMETVTTQETGMRIEFGPGGTTIAIISESMSNTEE